MSCCGQTSYELSHKQTRCQMKDMDKIFQEVLHYLLWVKWYGFQSLLNFNLKKVENVQNQSWNLDFRTLFPKHSISKTNVNILMKLKPHKPKWNKFLRCQSGSFILYHTRTLSYLNVKTVLHSLFHC